MGRGESQASQNTRSLVLQKGTASANTMPGASFRGGEGGGIQSQQANKPQHTHIHAEPLQGRSKVISSIRQESERQLPLSVPQRRAWRSTCQTRHKHKPQDKAPKRQRKLGAEGEPLTHTRTTRSARGRQVRIFRSRSQTCFAKAITNSDW